jgi:hypothetical protein
MKTLEVKTKEEFKITLSDEEYKVLTTSNDLDEKLSILHKPLLERLLKDLEDSLQDTLSNTYFLSITDIESNEETQIL